VCNIFCTSVPHYTILVRAHWSTAGCAVKPNDMGWLADRIYLSAAYLQLRTNKTR